MTKTDSNTPSSLELFPDEKAGGPQESSHATDYASRGSDLGKRPTNQANRGSKTHLEEREANDDHQESKADKTQLEQKSSKSTIDSSSLDNLSLPVTTTDDPHEDVDPTIKQMNALLKNVTLSDRDSNTVKDNGREPLRQLKSVPLSPSRKLGSESKAVPVPKRHEPLREPRTVSKGQEPICKPEAKLEPISILVSESPGALMNSYKHADKEYGAVANWNKKAIRRHPDTHDQRLSNNALRAPEILTRKCIVVKGFDKVQCTSDWDTGRYAEERHLCEVHKKLSFLKGHLFRSHMNNAEELQRFLFSSERPIAGRSLANAYTSSSSPSAARWSSCSACSNDISCLVPARWYPMLINIEYLGEVISVFNEETFQDLTRGVDPLLRRNIWQLIVDYFVLVSPHTPGLRVWHQGGRESYFARKQIYGEEDKYVSQCVDEGYVYVLLYPPSKIGLEKMVEESREVAKKSIALKIGYSTNPGNRLSDHYIKCNMRSDLSRTFPNALPDAGKTQGSLPFAHLFEKVIHELLVAHQHDIWCMCRHTHLEMFWFERVPGDEDGSESYERAMNRLIPTFEKWMRAFQNLAGLHELLFRTIKEDDLDLLAHRFASISVSRH
ncbi:hypothetical protein BGZ65_005263 [Modicella reniformis]|uniref:Bacteriophage T5 Orf172 DNA-binding domain-containing protein n=1 Tax=Modicella reniformis TaxID=1440133 RepID=A0A9P6M8L5_9FUNG|nr:hypothetical protein BGZ65_005263 [Modicella reniformis]